MVTDDDSGQSIQGDERTSSGMFLDKAQDEIVAGIEARIAALTFFPEVKPRKVDSLLFFSLHPVATADLSSLHGSCPVIECEEWSTTKWIHLRTFDIPSKSSSSDCIDKDPHWLFTVNVKEILNTW
ncbi:probable prolyl 4-hydroxylase 7 [Olea europaea subsp. europaea]|uniref:Probable prolyl 4-hydroxylase 7 n=1 Tax=Olea europaea subsp. europaea TaxID=158383 RepID=A0A8S0TKW8_OLEEU|nr:probable prolyl 4-hydroxylase 7 [Olea europaea subsp. europaea]